MTNTTMFEPAHQEFEDRLEAAGVGVSYSYGEWFEMAKARWNLDCSKLSNTRGD